jgi:hypothetical protein
MSQLYDLIQKRRGKETIMMTDTLPKVNDRMKQLRSSQRKGIKGDKVVYSVRPSEEQTEKFRRKAYSEAWRAGDYALNPRRK